MKPGSATQPLPGIKPLLVDAGHNVLSKVAASGKICASRPHGRGRCAPFGATTAASSRPISRAYPGRYFTGDGCRRDEDGYYWIIGRLDDVINVAGHRIGTAEVESSLVTHPTLPKPRSLASQRDQRHGTLRLRHPESGQRRRRCPAQRAELHVRNEIGALAAPEKIHFAPPSPKLVPAKSCAASCARSPRARPKGSGTHQRSLILRWSRRCSPAASSSARQSCAFSPSRYPFAGTQGERCLWRLSTNPGRWRA